MTEHQPDARAVCEHFYASHCYRGMSIRLCMTCGEPDWDDLAEQLKGRAPAAPPPPVAADLDPGEATRSHESARGLPDAESPSPASPEPSAPIVAAPDRTVALCPGCLHDGVLEQTLDRARAAEAKLAAIAEHCRLRMNAPGRSGMTMAAAGLILGMAEGSSEEEAPDGQ